MHFFFVIGATVHCKSQTAPIENQSLQRVRSKYKLQEKLNEVSAKDVSIRIEYRKCPHRLSKGESLVYEQQVGQVSVQQVGQVSVQEGEVP